MGVLLICSTVTDETELNQRRMKMKMPTLSPLAANTKFIERDRNGEDIDAPGSSFIEDGFLYRLGAPLFYPIAEDIWDGNVFIPSGQFEDPITEECQWEAPLGHVHKN